MRILTHGRFFFLFSDSDLESVITLGAFGGVFSLGSGQSQNRFTFGTRAENMGSGIRGTVTSTPFQLRYQAKKHQILMAALGNVAGQAAEGRPDEEAESDDVKSEGQIGKNVGDHAEDGKDRA